MQRRKFLIGLGSLAAGSAAATGTGAFTSASAERNADIVTAGDAGAFLKLAPCDGPNAHKYVDYSGGTLGLNLDADSDGPGNGLNQEANFRIKDLFKISNHGSQPVTVYIDGATSADAGKRLKWVNENGGGDGATRGSVDGTTIDVGETIVVGLDLQFRGNDVGDVISDEITVRAEAN
ncbi:hypothetical protein [Haloarcula litorea]|uniref:hypothetical protein n=1 Tax=Haloarcula litorea TaxID=3032579 RepID=UPI0023E87AED|nr:hypothetical protein [Halomicroarcula sp. GDY20]